MGTCAERTQLKKEQINEKIKLTAYYQTMTVIRLPAHTKIEPWMCPVGGPEEAPICGMLRTKDELSIVLPSGQVPDNLTDSKTEGGWSCIKIEGPLDFALVGILSSIA